MSPASRRPRSRSSVRRPGYVSRVRSMRSCTRFQRLVDDAKLRRRDMRPLGLRRVHLELATVAPLPASLPAHRGASVDPGAAFRARPTYTNLGQWRRDFLVVEDPNDAEEPEWVWDFVR